MMGHDILEVPAIPRDRKTLAGVIGQARYERRKGRMMNYAAIACVLVGVIILVTTFTPTRPPASSAPSSPARHISMPEVRQ